LPAVFDQGGANMFEGGCERVRTFSACGDEAIMPFIDKYGVVNDR
jgi:hypothetical protein